MKLSAAALVLLVSVAWASSALERHYTSSDEDGDGLSLIQTKSRASSKQPYGAADRSLQAPPEGGPFSKFYNTRNEGNGIHKWLQYFPAYERHFGKYIGKEVHIVEIGIQSGGSMDMWKGVFGPRAHVYGCDIQPNCKAYEDNQTKIFIGDQESPAFWKDFLKEVPKIDILIDDGGHTVEQQVATLGIMLEHLAPDGIYITEDVHGSANAFWHGLALESLSSPGGKHYSGLGKLISSVHIYPYLLVIEREKNARASSMARQLGTTAATKLPEVQWKAVSADTTSRYSDVQSTLGDALPFLPLGEEEVISAKGGDRVNLQTLLEEVPARGWLVVRDGKEAFSFDTPWDAMADKFMGNIISDFRWMHDGDCCNWNANPTQKTVDSLHIYPHLLIAQRTASKDRLIKAPQHGTQWIPY